MIAFTICSNNYLAEAISLGNSMLDNTKSDVRYFIYLTDKFNNDIDYKAYRFPILEVNDNICPGYTEITTKYDIVELSTAVKPGVCKYLMKTNPGETLFYYFDPDIYFFADIDRVTEDFGDNVILLTPHVVQPIKPGIEPFENTFLNYGVFNLGFIGLKRSPQALALLDWWENRTMTFGINDPANGLFVDQLWINFVPIYYEGVKISRHIGFNTAYWNINERVISRKDNSFIVNDEYPLVFFHFSSFDFSLQVLARRAYTHPSYDTGIIRELSTIYKQDLETNQYQFFRKYKPSFAMTYDAYLTRNFNADSSNKKMKVARQLYNLMPTKIRDRFIRTGYILGVLRNWKN